MKTLLSGPHTSKTGVFPGHRADKLSHPESQFSAALSDLKYTLPKRVNE